MVSSRRDLEGDHHVGVDTEHKFGISQQLRCLNQLLAGVVAFTRHLSNTKEDEKKNIFQL
jgi:hypothetical protein